MPEQSKITYTSSAVEAMTKRVDDWRAQIGAARMGINAADGGHTHGVPWANLTVAAGGDNFTSGAYLEKRLVEVGGLVDKLLTGFETKLSSTSKALRATGDKAAETEKSNTSKASQLTVTPPA
ncbi:hypothetical protein AB0J86_33435 [Micromonospora sp. NPDC049559]|uniref:hypothetical protein n=1 Tax=Micromonospora sp. NPDC049559 TaxID=3155923 RepID=UPI003444372B